MPDWPKTGEYLTLGGHDDVSTYFVHSLVLDAVGVQFYSATDVSDQTKDILIVIAKASLTADVDDVRSPYTLPLLQTYRLDPDTMCLVFDVSSMSPLSLIIADKVAFSQLTPVTSPESYIVTALMIAVQLATHIRERTAGVIDVVYHQTVFVNLAGRIATVDEYFSQQILPNSEDECNELLSYCAPELLVRMDQSTSPSQSTTSASCLFSIGAILHKTLYGYSAFSGVTHDLAGIREAQIEQAGNLASGPTIVPAPPIVQSELQTTVRRLLSLSASDRSKPEEAVDFIKEQLSQCKALHAQNRKERSRGVKFATQLKRVLQSSIFAAVGISSFAAAGWYVTAMYLMPGPEHPAKSSLLVFLGTLFKFASSSVCGSMANSMLANVASLLATLVMAVLACMFLGLIAGLAWILSVAAATCSVLLGIGGLALMWSLDVQRPQASGWPQVLARIRMYIANDID